MSRDGSGNYTRVPGSAYTNGTIADGAELDAEINDIATALTQSLAKDGQTVPTANLPMGGFRHTNVNTASARTEYARASQVQDGTLTHLTSVSGADTITASAPIGLSAYATGQKFSFVSAGANTGAVTLNINSIGAKPVTKDGATALAAGDIASGAVCVVVYDGTQFQLVSARVVSAASDTIAGVVELATAAEVQAGTDTVRAVTPAGLQIVCPTGAVLSFAMAVAPTGWLACNGAAVSRATYAKLFAAIGTTFGPGDGSTTFNIPDLRGEFLRGWDNARGVDSGRVFGSAQADDFKSHQHAGPTLRSDQAGSAGPAVGSVAWGSLLEAAGGNETRPRNIALLFCIKY